MSKADRKTLRTQATETAQLMDTLTTQVAVEQVAVEQVAVEQVAVEQVYATLHFVKLFNGGQTCYTPSGQLGRPALKANFPQGALPRNPAHVTITNPLGLPPVIRLFTAPIAGGSHMAYKGVASNGGRHAYVTPAGMFHVDTGLLAIVPTGLYADVALVGRVKGITASAIVAATSAASTAVAGGAILTPPQVATLTGEVTADVRARAVASAAAIMGGIGEAHTEQVG